jgi:hypothetical protein
MKPALAFTIALVAQPAFAIDFPTMKSGLWESKVSRFDAANSKQSVTKWCIDAEVQKEVMEMSLGMARSMCAKRDIRREGNRIINEAECTVGETTLTTTSTMTFNGDTSYTTVSKAKYTPAFNGRTESTTVTEGRWTGPCSADLRPGDIISPSGQKMNVETILGTVKK